MALPIAKTFADAADLSQTLRPYLPQLYAFPDQFWAALASGPKSWYALKVLYVSTNPLISAAAFTIALFPIFLILSEITRNWSQVDRIWSILPTIYNVHWAVYAHAAGVPTKRNDTLAFFSIMWSIRLTYNYWRKGGYESGSEDYRWPIIRNYTGKTIFFLFNIVFISSLQLLLLFSVTFPGYIMLVSAKGIGETAQMADIIFSRGIGLLVLLSYLADQQQWNFFEAKKVYKQTAKAPAGYYAEDMERGFNVTGMFAYSRHPNFLFEQLVWVTQYLWGAYITRGYINWSICGALSYLLLFQGSTWLTELISVQKYPEYKEYQRRVGRFIPRISGGAPGNFSDQRKNK